MHPGARTPSVQTSLNAMKSRVEPTRLRRSPNAEAPRGSGRSPFRKIRRLPGAWRLSVLPLLLLAGACGGVDRFPMTWTEPRSDFARELWGLQQLTNYLGVGVGILVFGILAYIVVRFRWRPGAPEPSQVHGNTRMELAWMLAPALLLAVIAVPTVRIIFSTQEDPPPDALTIDVIAHQWWWEFRYPMAEGDTVITANEVHIPVGRTVHLRLTSADVVHNFWVPQMGGKRYNIPNRINHIIFTPEETGVYLGQCAEFCGESHALMKKRMFVHTPEGFDEWLRNEASPAVEPTDSALIIGQQLTIQNCAACHIIEGTDAQFGRAGPYLTHFARRRTLAAGILDNNAQNLADWIRDPQALKPGALMPNLGLSEDEIGYIVAYLQTLY